MTIRLHVVPIYGWGWFTPSGDLVDVPAPFDLDFEPMEAGSTALLAHFATNLDHPLNGMWVSLTPRHAPADEHMNLSATRQRPSRTSVLHEPSDAPEITGFALAHGPSVDLPMTSPDNPTF